MVKKERKNNKPYVKEKKEFQEEVLEIRRVTRVVKGGRRLRFRATMVIGDKKGRVGIGLGKSNEVAGAIQKAIARAKRKMITLPIQNGSIPHSIKVKFKSAQLLLMPASPGTGLIVGGAARKVVELAGVTDIMGKSFGTTNKVSNAKATMKALSLLRENKHIKEVVKETKIEDKPQVKTVKAKDLVKSNKSKKSTDPKAKAKKTVKETPNKESKTK